MDHHSSLEQEVRVDLESLKLEINTNEEGGLAPDSEPVFTNPCDHFMSMDDHLVKLVDEDSPANSFMVLMDGKLDRGKSGDFPGKEKRKKASSAKKPPKPPRPQRGFSLDATDQKLIKELTELAMIKRARIERMKALMQKKASKASSSSNGSLFAMLFTIIFFLVIIFQGMSCQKSHGTYMGSPQTAQTNENALIYIQGQLNISVHDSV